MSRVHSPAGTVTCSRFLFSLLFQVITCFNSVFSQTDHYEKVFTIENGLPHNHVLSITSDKTGFLWIGTWDGLSRFDGYEFHNYHHDPNDSTTIPYFTCPEICVDRYNNVWIYHVGEMLSKYQRNTDNFKDYSRNSDPVLSKIEIGDIETDPFGNLIVCGSNGIALYDSAINGFRQLSIVKAGVQMKYLGIALVDFDNTGNIWLSVEGMLYKGIYPKDKLSVIITDSVSFTFEHYRYPRASSDLHQYSFLELSDNSVWLCSNRGLRRVPSGEFAAAFPPDKPNDIGFKWSRVNDKIIVLSDAGDFEIKLNPDESPQTLYVDQSGTVWYSTTYLSGMSTGLHRYNKTPTYFRHYLPEINGMPSVIHTIAKDDEGNLFIGADGLNYIPCITREGKFLRQNIISNEDARQYQHLRCLLPVEGGFYAGYMKGRLDFYDYSTHTFRNICLTDERPWIRKPYGFRSLYSNDKGRILIGSMGLFSIDINEPEKFSRIWQGDPPGSGIYCLNLDSSGNVWAGAGSLLIKLNEDFQLDTIYVISNITYNIEDICDGAGNELWMALLGGGILRYNPETGKKRFFTTADGLSNNTTYSILKDRQQHLWITTDNGISRFDPKTEKFRIFGPTDGLMIHEFNSDASFLDHDGTMYFGGMGGVVSFHPDSIDDQDAAYAGMPLVITEFRVSGVPRYFDHPVYENSKVELEKGEDNFGVTYACLDLKNAEKIKYRYRISGYHENWTESDHLHRSINITGLKPSTYYLEIQSSDIFGSWNKKLLLEIRIPPKFYETKAFSIIAVLLVILIIFMFFRLNNRQIRIKENQKQQYLKLESIRGQMNPHFIFNSLNSINYFIANNDRLAANRYIANFSKLIRSFLSNMSQEYISLSDEIDSLRDYLKLEFLRFSDKFEYELSVEQIGSIEKWDVFPGMVQPFIENAIWHGVRGLKDRKGFIRVIFTENNGIHCLITDNGIGRQLAAKNRNFHENKKSRGMRLIMERIQLINHLESKNYKISIDDLFSDKEECGTRVEIEIPSKIKL